MGRGGWAFTGTSGWRYDAWREDFYAGRPAGEWLRFCAGRITGIEVDATFYRLQSLETFRRWRREPLAPIRLERGRAAGLGAKLAVVLWQLPRNALRQIELLPGR